MMPTLPSLVAQKSGHDANFVIIDGTIGFHYDNL